MWIIFIILPFKAESIPNITSFQPDYIKYQNFQTLSKDIYLTDPTASTPQIFAVVLTTARTSPLSNAQICFGFRQLMYDTDWHYASGPDEYRQKMSFQLNLINLVNSGFDMQFSRRYGGLYRVRLNFYIWDSTFYHSSLFQTYLVTFNSGSLTQSINIGFHYNNCKIIPFLQGLTLVSRNEKFGYTQGHPIGSTNNSFDATLNIYGNDANFQVIIKYLVINQNGLVNKASEVYYYSEVYNISTTTVQTLQYSNFVSFYSYMMTGLQSFKYDVSNHPSGVYDFQYNFVQSGPSVLSYTLDSGFQRIMYNLVIVTFRYCQDPYHPILFRNLSTNVLECFNQCYDGYYLVYSSYQFRCNRCSYKCALCDQASKCSTCATEFYMDSNETCQLRKQYFCEPTNISNIHSCTYHSNLTNCLECQTNGYYCQKCDNSYYLDGNNLCQPCNPHFPNCINCTISECNECVSPLTLLNTTYCDNPANSSTISRLLPCKDIRCASCLQSALDDCLRCSDNNLVIKDGYCVNNCGNGLIYSNFSDSSTQVCDDGNSIDFDGCSSNCSTIQLGFNCINTSLIPNTTCYYSQPITLTLISTKKLLLQNKVELILRNSAPNILVWSTFDVSALKEILSLRVPNMEADQKGYNFQYTVKFIKYTTSGNARLLQSNQSFDGSLYEYLFVQIYYTASVIPGVSLNNQIVDIIFSPNISRMIIFNINSSYYTPPSLVRFSLNSDQNFLVQYFPPDYLSSCQTIQGFSLFISIMTLLMIGIAIIAQFLDGINAKQMIITIQTTCIVQFTYFSLLGIGPLNPMFASMAYGLKYTSGFDINLSSTMTKIKQLMGMNITSGNIEGNLNLSIIIPFLFLIVGLVLLLIKRLQKIKNPIKEQNYNQIEEIEKKQQIQNTENIQKQISKQLNVNPQNFIQKPQNLIANFGFCLFIFFLYKCFVFIIIQAVENMDQIQLLGIFIIGLLGFLLLFLIFTLFRKFQLYQNMAQKISYIKPLPICKQTVLRNYFLLFIFERLINSFSVTVLGSFPFNGFIPLLIYILKQIFIYKYLQNIYHPSHKIRLYLTYLFGITIQILLITRRIFIQSAIKGQGGEQSTFGLYLPYTILILLMIILLKGITFQIYSIKRIRCCKLDIQWQNQTKNKNQKVKKLQNLQDLNNNDSIIDEQIKNNPLKNKLGQNILKYQPYESINKKLLQKYQKKSKNIYDTHKTNKSTKSIKQQFQQKQKSPINFNKSISAQQQSSLSLDNNNPTQDQNKEQNYHSNKNIEKNQMQIQISIPISTQIQPNNNQNQNQIKSKIIKKQLKNQLQKLRLTKKQLSKQNNKKDKNKLKINYKLNQTNQQQQEEYDLSYFGLNKNKQTKEYKYTDQKKYFVREQFDMI